MRFARCIAVSFCTFALSLGCGPGTSTGESDVEEQQFEPAAPVILRLTQAQYRNTIQDFFGPEIVVPSSLEPDTQVDGMESLGAAIASLSPRGAELYEEAARNIAKQAFEKEEIRASLLNCTPTNATDTECFQQFASLHGRRLWRRSLTGDELDVLASIGVQVATALEDPVLGLEYILSAMLQSPYFVYRIEMGEGDVAPRKLNAFELASRLSFFFWTSGPDDEILDAAAAGALDTEEGLQSQIDRLMADDRSVRAVRNFFKEWLTLGDLDDVSKDPNIFKHYSADLGQMAREETLLLAEYLVFDLDTDIQHFLTTRTTFVNRRLAAIYNVPAVVDEGYGQIQLPADGPRAGFLGQVSFLGLHSHPVSSSATLRGIFLREKLLCESQPPPPAGLNTAVPPATSDEPTLKDRLAGHMTDPFCASCHELTDVIGLGFENFDGIGLHRSGENGHMIDPSGHLDGVEFVDALDLARAVSESEKFSRCVVQKLYAYGVGHEPEQGEEGLIDALTDDFQSNGRRIKDLMLAIALSDGFRYVGEIVP